MTRHPALFAAEAEAVDAGRGFLRGCVDGDESLYLWSTETQPAELMPVYRGVAHRFPVDERLAPKTIHRIWRATRR